MHISVEHSALQKALELIARVSTKHLALPVLQCVVMDATKDHLLLRGTNLEVSIECTIPVQTTTEGSVSVSASVLLQTITLISQKDVVLKMEGETLIVETKTSKSSIVTISGDDFPTIPKIEVKGQTVQGKLFAQGIKTAAFAASQSSIKPELGSVYIFQKKEHSLTFVATDSFRLVEKTTPQQHVALQYGVLVPYKNSFELAHVCEIHDENPTLLINENQCALQFENVYITSRLTTGTFPDYEQIIPKEYSTHTTLLTADLTKALKKTGIFLNKFMQLTLTAKRSTLVMTSKSEIGTTTEELPATSEGDEIALSFNQRYIQEILPFMADESTTLHFAGIGRPMVIEGVHDRSLRYLVMPMNK